VSVHFFARAAAQEGHEVRVFVVGVGPINILKSPALWKLPSKEWTEFQPGVLEYTPKEFNSPVDLRNTRANDMSEWFFQSYGRTVDREISYHTASRSPTCNICVAQENSREQYTSQRMISRRYEPTRL
jgi:hypothetical protein